jgi:hypothetical protein
VEGWKGGKGHGCRQYEMVVQDRRCVTPTSVCSGVWVVWLMSRGTGGSNSDTCQQGYVRQQVAESESYKLCRELLSCRAAAWMRLRFVSCVSLTVRIAVDCSHADNKQVKRSAGMSLSNVHLGKM